MVDKDTFLDLFINSLEKKMKEMISLSSLQNQSIFYLVVNVNDTSFQTLRKLNLLLKLLLGSNLSQLLRKQTNNRRGKITNPQSHALLLIKQNYNHYVSEKHKVCKCCTLIKCFKYIQTIIAIILV